MKKYISLLLFIFFTSYCFSQKIDSVSNHKPISNFNTTSKKPLYAKDYLEIARNQGDFNFRIENGDTIISTKLWIYRQNGYLIRDSIMKNRQTNALMKSDETHNK